MNAIEQQVLSIIGENESSPDVFSDITQIRDSINAAVGEICAATGSYTSTYLLPLESGKRFYEMTWTDDGFGYVIEAWDAVSRWRLPQTSPATLATEDPGWLKRSGIPTAYFMIGTDIIAFDRRPSESGRLIELSCVAIPRSYNSDVDPVRLLEVYQRATVDYAVSEFFASRGDATRAKEYLDRYLETAGISRFKPQSQPPTSFQTQASSPPQ